MLTIPFLSSIQNFNIYLFYLINNSLSNNFLNTILPYFTELGSFLFLLTLCVIIFIIGGKKGKKVAIMGLLGIGLTSLLFLIIKPLVGEPRPFLSLAHVNLLVVETGVYSFPSGHTSLIFTLATILGLNYEFKIFKRKILFIYPALIIAGIVGFSRIYVGVHYPFDIIGGMILGIISGLTVIKLCKYIFKIKKIEKILS